MQRGATFRPDLQDAYLELTQSISGFMGAEIMPVKFSATKSGNFEKVAISEKKNPDLQPIAPGGAYPRVQHKTTSDNFTCQKHGLEEPVTEEDLKELGNYFDAEVFATNKCISYLLTDHERRVAAEAFDAVTNFTAGQSNFGDVSNEWDDASNATVYADVHDAVYSLKNNIEDDIMPGTEICLAMSEKVYRNVIATNDIKGRLSGGDGSAQDKVGDPGRARLASLLNLDHVFVSNKKFDGSDIWDDEYALLYLRRTDPMLRGGVQFGRTIVWEEFDGALYATFSYEEEQTDSTVIKVRQHTDEKVLSVLAGYLLGNITS